MDIRREMREVVISAANTADVTPNIKSMSQSERKVFKQMLESLNDKNKTDFAPKEKLDGIRIKLQSNITPEKSSILQRIGKWFANHFLGRVSSESLVKQFNALAPKVKTETVREAQVEIQLAKQKTEFNEGDINKEAGKEVGKSFHIFEGNTELSLLNAELKNNPENVPTGTHFIKKHSKREDSNALVINLRGEWKEFGLNKEWKADKVMRMVNLLNDNLYGLDFQKLKRAVEEPISSRWDDEEKYLHGLTTLNPLD